MMVRATIIDNFEAPPVGMKISSYGIELASVYVTTGKKGDGLIRLNQNEMSLKDLAILTNRCRSVLAFMNSMPTDQWTEIEGHFDGE